MLQASVRVRLNMSEPNNGQTVTLHNSEAAQGFTAERVLRTRPKTYRAIVRLLADPHASVNQIAKLHRVSTHTVRAIRCREAKTIADRKQSLISIFGSVAEMSAERMEELCGKASLRDAGISAGIATDKMLALTGQMPVSTQVAVIQMPTPEQDERRCRVDYALDEITRMLSKPGPLDPKEELMIKTQLCVLSSGRSADE